MVTMIACEHDDGVVAQCWVVEHVVNNPPHLGVHEGHSSSVRASLLLNLPM